MIVVVVVVVVVVIWDRCGCCCCCCLIFNNKINVFEEKTLLLLPRCFQAYETTVQLVQFVMGMDHQVVNFQTFQADDRLEDGD